MFESINTYFEGNGLFVGFYALLLAVLLVVVLMRSFKKHKRSERVYYVDMEYQKENTTDLFIAPKQIDTSY